MGSSLTSLELTTLEIFSKFSSSGKSGNKGRSGTADSHFLKPLKICVQNPAGAESPNTKKAPEWKKKIQFFFIILLFSVVLFVCFDEKQLTQAQGRESKSSPWLQLPRKPLWVVSRAGISFFQLCGSWRNWLKKENSSSLHGLLKLLIILYPFIPEFFPTLWSSLEPLLFLSQNAAKFKNYGWPRWKSRN